MKTLTLGRLLNGERRGTKMELNNTLSDIIDKYNKDSSKYVIRRGNSSYIIEKIIGYHEYESVTYIPFEELENVSYAGDIAALIYIYISELNRDSMNKRINKIKKYFKGILSSIKDLFVKKSNLFDEVEEKELEGEM